MVVTAFLHAWARQTAQGRQQQVRNQHPPPVNLGASYIGVTAYSQHARAQGRGDLHRVVGREAHEAHAFTGAALHAHIGQSGPRHQAACATEEHFLLNTLALLQQAHLRAQLGFNKRVRAVLGQHGARHQAARAAQQHLCLHSFDLFQRPPGACSGLHTRARARAGRRCAHDQAARAALRHLLFLLTLPGSRPSSEGRHACMLWVGGFTRARSAL